MTSLVVMRCNAGHQTGLGHVSRCLRLAGALRQRGAAVRFVLGTAEAVERVQQAGFMADILPPRDDGTAFLALVRQLAPLAVVLDARPPYPRAVVKELKAYTRVVILDDSSEHRWEADAIYLPPTPHVLALDWTGFTGQRYIGMEWMLMGSTFTPCPPQPPQSPLRLLLLTGGSDPWGYMARLAPPLATCCTQLGMTLGLVVGPNFRDREQQLAQYRALDPVPKIFDNPPSMTDVYAWCDAAITVFCVSAYELAACGRPALYICPDKNYEDHARVFEHARFGRILWRPSEEDFSLTQAQERLAAFGVAVRTTKDRNVLAADAAERIAGQIIDGLTLL